jgi:hypothetical protein
MLAKRVHGEKIAENKGKSMLLSRVGGKKRFVFETKT